MHFYYMLNCYFHVVCLTFLYFCIFSFGLYKTLQPGETGCMQTLDEYYFSLASQTDFCKKGVCLSLVPTKTMAGHKGSLANQTHFRALRKWVWLASYYVVGVVS